MDKDRMAVRLEMMRRLDEFDPAEDAVAVLSYIHFRVLHQPPELPGSAVPDVSVWPDERIERAIDYAMYFDVLSMDVIMELVIDRLQNPPEMR